MRAKLRSRASEFSVLVSGLNTKRKTTPPTGAPPAGFEPGTSSLPVRRSTRLSYRGECVFPCGILSFL